MNLAEQPERRRARNGAKHAQRGIETWPGVVTDLPDGDQRRERIADDGQPDEAIPASREEGELEGELGDEPPRLPIRTQPTRQSAHRQDRNRERAVLAVDRFDRLGDDRGIEAAGRAFNPRLGALDGSPVLISRVRRHR